MYEGGVLGCTQEALLVCVGTTVPRAEALPSAHQLVLERCAARHTYACVMRACDTHSDTPLGLHMHAAAVLLSPSHWNVRAHQLLWLVSFGPALQAGRASAFPDTHLLLKCLGSFSAGPHIACRLRTLRLPAMQRLVNKPCSLARPAARACEARPSPALHGSFPSTVVLPML